MGKFKKGFLILIGLGLFLSATINSYAKMPTQKPISEGPVRVVGRQLQVDFDGDGIYQPFFVKGLGYQPTPIGTYPDQTYWTYRMYQTPAVYNRDLPLLRDMKCNAIRTWATLYFPNRPTQDCLAMFDAFYNNGSQPVYIMAGFWVDPQWNPVTGQQNQDLTDPDVINYYEDLFRTYVQTYKDHPALLLWNIGNENNIAYYGPGGARAWFELAENLAEIAYEEEGQNYHPVAIGNGGLSHIGNSGYSADDASLEYVDIWAMNFYEYYPEQSFGEMFEDYTGRSAKPLLINEYGIDAYDNNGGGLNQPPLNSLNGGSNQNQVIFDPTGNEDQLTQAQWNTALFRDLIENNDIDIGGSIMEYSDEWWKDWGTPGSHDLGGFPNGSFPDGFMNEEWFGVMAIQDNGSNPDTIIPRQAYTDLGNSFAPFSLNLDVPFHLAGNSNYDGSASSQMVLDYLGTSPLLTQTQLQDYGRSHNDPVNSSLPYIDAWGMEAILEHYEPYGEESGYMFGIGREEDALVAMAGLCYWISFDLSREELDPPFVPGIVPAYGTYQRWMLVKGVATELDPQLANNYTLNGIWVHDPDISGIGQNKYILGDEWLSTYFLPLVSNDSLNGKYVYVVEPPTTSDAKVGVKETKKRYIPKEHLGDNATIINACIEGLNDEVVTNDKNVSSYLDNTIPTKVINVSDFKGADYYLVVFENKQINADEVYNEENSASVLMVAKLDAKDLSIQEVSYVGEPVKYLPINQDEALAIARTNVPSFSEASSIKLIQEELKSPFAPTWQITDKTTADIYYVGQDGSFKK